MTLRNNWANGELFQATDINDITNAVNSVAGTNIKVYGATGDGSTDDTAAIHAARDAAGVGGVVVVPPGTYVTTGLSLNKVSQTWQILPGATIKCKSSGYGAQTINVDAAGVTITGGGTVDGNRAGIGSHTSGVYAVITGTVNASDLTLDGITVQNSSYYGVWAQASRTRVRRCTFTANYFVPILLSSYYLAVQVGSTMQDTYDMEASDNYIDRTGEGVSIASAAIQIRGNVGSGSPGDTAHTTYRGKALRNTILMPASPTDTTGLVCGIEFGANSYYGLAESNTIVNGTMGISFAFGNYGKAVGNTLIGQTLYGIELAKSSGCVLQGNVIDGASLLGSVSGGSGIVLGGGTAVSNDIVITGNRIFGMYSQGYGISNNSAGVRVSITGNSIDSLKPIFLVSVSDIVIAGNSLRDVTASASTPGVLIGDCVNVVVASNQIRYYNKGVALSAATIAVDYINVSNNFIRQCTVSIDGATSGSGTIGTNIVNAGNVVSAT